MSLNWRSEQTGPLQLRISRMATEASTSGNEEHRSSSKSFFVHPEKFYGYPNDDVLDWFASFERIARANEWDGVKKGRMISAYLRGPAGDHFEKLNEEDKANFGIIKNSLIERFSPADMRRSAYSNLAGRKQGKLESVNEFASAIQRLVFRSFPSDVTNEVIEMTAREHFILGLRNELMRRVTMADPKTFSDAIRIALREEALESSSSSYNGVNAVEKREDQMTDLIGMLGKLLAKNGETNHSNYGRNNCRSPRYNNASTRNRYTRDGRPICNHCNKVGHIEKKCFVKNPSLREGASQGNRNQNQGN